MTDSIYEYDRETQQRSIHFAGENLTLSLTIGFQALSLAEASTVQL